MSYGKYTYGKPTIKFENPYAKLTVGKFCSIGGNVIVYLGGEHRTDYITTYPFGYMHLDVFPLNRQYDSKFTKGDVIIGNDVWIGDNVTIMSGITIGDGAVIANSSHIVKNVEPYTIVGGNPARLIKYRFSSEEIVKLLELKWWNWDDTKIKENIELLHSTDIISFLSKQS